MELMSVCFIHEANIYQVLAMHKLCAFFAHRELSTEKTQDHTGWEEGLERPFSFPKLSTNFPPHQLARS